MPRNYYVILGVDPNATQDQIKSAYRRKAKQLHPDCYQGGSQPFLAVHEAYKVLSDPARRWAYDDRLDRERRPPRTRVAARGRPLWSSRCPVEPLIPTKERTDLGRAGLDPLFRSPFEAIYDRLWDDLGVWAPPGVERMQDMHVSISLTPEQLRYGGRVRIWLPVRATCPACRGQGHVGFFECWECAGAGSIVTESPVSIAIPARVPRESVARVSLDRLGLHDVSLVIHFRALG